MAQAYYSNSIATFLLEDTNTILGKLNTANTKFSTQYTYTTISWERSIFLLKSSLKQIVAENADANDWTILLEYEVPRLHTRIDAVILADDLIFIIEYKDERNKYEAADIRQVEDYALDLKDFHLQSRDHIIIPILLAPLASDSNNYTERDNTKLVQPTIKANADNLASLITRSYSNNHFDNNKIDAVEWIDGTYSPTPTIIQAAQALFAGHSVESITKSGADEYNLTKTTDYLIDVIGNAKEQHKKVVCFVTGVPGAGKTLVGLNIIHRDEFNEENKSSAAYFSGNGPLIKVLREALTRDELVRQKASNKDANLPKPARKLIEAKVEAKIQNLHSFIKDGIRGKKKTFERIVIFDEAQRCWSADHFYNKTVRNQNREKEDNRFDPIKQSEAEILFEIMERQEDWSVIIALVGNGQEINTGEAGIEEWMRVLSSRFNDWDVHLSPELVKDNNKITKHRLEFSKKIANVYTNQHLHLNINQRSFRANNLNEWVNECLSNNPKEALALYNSFKSNFPIYITRDLSAAKRWLTEIKQGNKRIGLITSSGALRLRPYGISTKESINEAMWFLNEEDDIRSSNHLELAATEFGVQGLELDWTGVCWDADLRRNKDEWDYKNFAGTSWKNVKPENESERKFILNTYRVLLTRAREGMVIFVPQGDIADATRLPKFYDPIYKYLKSCGIQDLPAQ